MQITVFGTARRGRGRPLVQQVRETDLDWTVVRVARCTLDCTDREEYVREMPKVGAA